MTAPVDTPPVYIDDLNRFDIEKLGLTDDDILRAVEDALRMQGLGKTESDAPRSGL